MLYKQQSFSNFEPDLRYLDSFPFSEKISLLWHWNNRIFPTKHFSVSDRCGLLSGWALDFPSVVCRNSIGRMWNFKRISCILPVISCCRSFQRWRFWYPLSSFQSRKYTLSDTLSSMQSIDLYRLTRPYKNIWNWRTSTRKVWNLSLALSGKTATTAANWSKSIRATAS